MNNHLLPTEQSVWQGWGILQTIFIILLGDLNYQLGYLALAMVVDTIFAIWVARRAKRFKWNEFLYKTTEKVTVYILVIILFHSLDRMLGLNGNARWTILFVLLVSDIFSSLRHLAALGYNNLSVMLGRGYWLLLGQHREIIGEENPFSDLGKEKDE